MCDPCYTQVGVLFNAFNDVKLTLRCYYEMLNLGIGMLC